MSTPSHRDAQLADITLLTVRQVAELLGIHTRSVWRMSLTGAIPAPIRLGHRVVRWRLSDLREHLDRKVGNSKGMCQ